MNRKLQKISLHIPVFLANASSVSERAARAMRPNGSNTPIAKLTNCNVITLHNRKLELQKGADLTSGEWKTERTDELNPTASSEDFERGGHDEG